MTNNEAGTPLWTNDRIYETIDSASQYVPSKFTYMMHPQAAQDIAATIRDDYAQRIANYEESVSNLAAEGLHLLERVTELEAARAADALRIISLEVQRNDYHQSVVDQDKQIYALELELSQLRAQVAAQGEWTPLADGIYDGLEVTGNEISLNSYDAYGIAWPVEHQFDDTIRLCRRTQPGGEGDNA